VVVEETSRATGAKTGVREREGREKGWNSLWRQRFVGSVKISGPNEWN